MKRAQVDGPHHFLNGKGSRRPNGPTLLKRRQLRDAGWRLVPVPYFHWRELSRDARTPEEIAERRRAYLACLLGLDAAATGDSCAVEER